ncbi:MAG: hypothetical protein HY867_15255 [Chloroflexi bacterium]|nr:hypothetical protein [Chloroflexota bacterium]
MEAIGINFGFLVVQLLAVLLWLGLPVITLLHLRNQKLNGVPLVLWVLLICAIPVLGALAYWIVKPTVSE